MANGPVERVMDILVQLDHTDVFCQCNCHFRVPRDAYDATRTTRDA